MKAISLWQPWASAIALGAKQVETRGWATSYRGTLAIHAAQRWQQGEQSHLQALPCFQAALWPLGYGRNGGMLPLGKIVAVCRILDCRPSESFTEEEIGEMHLRDGCPFNWCERDMGDFRPGRFGWVLGHIKAIEPIPYRGLQGLFGLSEAAEVAVLKQAGGLHEPVKPPETSLFGEYERGG